MSRNVLVNYIGKSGGGPAFAYEFSKGLANNGCNVYAVVSEYVDNRYEWENTDLFKEVYFIKTNRKRGKLYYFKAQFEFLLWGRKKIKKHFKSIEFDYVITTMQHLWSLDVSKLVNAKKIVWLCHDPIPHSGSGRMDTYLGNQFAKIADETVVLTKSFIPVVSERWGLDMNHIHYMPHGRQNMYKQSANVKCRYSENNVNFLFFGYIRDYKGLSVLAKAFKIIKEKYSHTTLTIAGSGNFEIYREEYMSIPDVVIENRYISDEEVANFFLGPNVVTVMPYLDATQSGVSLTAMEFGNVIIASDTGGLREQLDNGKIGLYCTPGDVNSLVEQMSLIIDNIDSIYDEQRLLMQKYLKSIEWNSVTLKMLNDIELANGGSV